MHRSSVKTNEDERERDGKVRVRGKRARDLDQFFTRPDVALCCVDELSSILREPLSRFELILEPSFGDGAFVEALRKRELTSPKVKYVDIDALDEAHRMDFLKADLKKSIVEPRFFHTAERGKGSLDVLWGIKSKLDKSRGTCLTIGNPPFGKNSSLAVAFFNRAAEFSAVIAFIVPRTFSKESVHEKLDLNFFLIRETLLEEGSFLFQGDAYDVPCVFQIWARGNHVNLFRGEVLEKAVTCVPKGPNPQRSVVEKVSETSDFKFVKSNCDPDFAIRRVGVNAGRIFTENPHLCSEQSHLFVKVVNRGRCEKVIENLRVLDLEHMEKKFQTAGNPSISKSEICRFYIDQFGNK